VIDTLLPPLYIRYLLKHYTKNIAVILFGLSLLFSSIDYLQQIHKLDIPTNAKISYIFYKWEESLGMLYPLALVFALIMTKLSLVKNANMVALHAFGYGKRRLIVPFLFVAFMVHLFFVGLHTTSFSYASDRAQHILQNENERYDVNNLFFKYQDLFVYVRHLDPLKQEIHDLTLFKVSGYRIDYIIKAPLAIFDGHYWNAKDATLKTLIYKDGVLKRYTVSHTPTIQTLENYKPKIIKSFYEGSVMTLLEAVVTWSLLQTQSINSDKVKASIYNKVILPFFSIGLVIILFFSLPIHGRMANLARSVALSIGLTIIIWGVLFGLSRLGLSGVILPELAILMPVLLFLFYSFYLLAKEG